MKTRELTCIGCPMGCFLTVKLSTEQEISVSGNNCPVGAKYAIEEVTNPKRTITSTVPVFGGTIPVVSVKTSVGVPKEKIVDCLCEIKRLKVAAPVAIGDILCENLENTGAAVIATKSILPKSEAKAARQP